ncbi:MAG: hypothetical protein WDZ90_02155 [Candidatus Paceibacterota bacterium]
MWRFALSFSVFVLLFLLVQPGAHSHAQVGSGNVAERRAALERNLTEIEAEIAKQQRLLEAKQEERVSLERDVAILDAKIEKSRLGIRARTIAIEQLSNDINDKNSKIGVLNVKLDREKESLAELIRKTNEIDNTTILEVLLSNQSFSDFFADIDSFQSVKLALRDSFVEIADTKVETREARELLERKRTEEVELRNIQELQKQQIEAQERERQRILDQTKGVEAVYQELIADRERSAAEIRAELFTLRDSAAIPFGEALDFANFASSKTGVRPALILGVLTQETRLGEFLGSGTWTIDMHPTRDQPVFPALMRELGLDPNRMPVSKKPGYGWGGAMGPSQFIPSTWVCYGGFININTQDCNNASRSLSWDQFWQGPWEYRASKDRIRALTGKGRASNPYENEDAFMATGLLMKDNGADAGTKSAERRAALRYFAGWTNASNPAYAFYGDGVMELAEGYQRQIDVLAGS